MEEKVKTTEEKQLKTSVSDEDFDVMDHSEIDEHSDKDKQTQHFNQHRSLPMQHVPQQKEFLNPEEDVHKGITPEDEDVQKGIPVEQTDSASGWAVSMENPGNVKVGAPQKGQPENTETEGKCNYSAWKLTKCGDVMLLKTDNEKIYLPRSVNPTNDPKLHIKEGKAFIITSKDEMIEIKRDINGKLILIQQIHAETGHKEQNMQTRNVQNEDKEKECHHLLDNASHDSKNSRHETEPDNRASSTLTKANEGLKNSMSVNVNANNQTDRTMNAVLVVPDIGDHGTDSVADKSIKTQEKTMGTDELTSSKSEHTNEKSMHENETGVDNMIVRQCSAEFSVTNEDTTNSSGEAEKDQEAVAIAKQLPDEIESCPANQATEISLPDVKINSLKAELTVSSSGEQNKNIDITNAAKSLTTPSGFIIQLLPVIVNNDGHGQYNETKINKNTIKSDNFSNTKTTGDIKATCMDETSTSKVKNSMDAQLDKAQSSDDMHVIGEIQRNTDPLVTELKDERKIQTTTQSVLVNHKCHLKDRQDSAAATTDNLTTDSDKNLPLDEKPKDQSYDEQQRVENVQTTKQQMEQGQQTGKMDPSSSSELENDLNERSNVGSAETERIKGETDDHERKEMLESKVAEYESVIEGQQRLHLAERAAPKDGSGDTCSSDFQTRIKRSDNSGNGDHLPSAYTTQQKSEELRHSVPPILERIVEHAKQQESTKHLFSGVEVSFEERGHDVICILTRKSDVPDSIVEDILNLPNKYEIRDVSFKDISYLSCIPDQEQMINELIQQNKKEVEYEFLFKVDSKLKKVFLATSLQPDADRLSGKIKRGLSTKHLILEGRMKNTTLTKQLQDEIHKMFGKKVVTELDHAVWKLQLAGLKSDVETVCEEFKYISKTLTVDSPEKLTFIERELDKGTFASHTNLVLTKRNETRERTGFVFYGPASQVGFLYHSISEAVAGYYTHHVNITESETLVYLNQNAGREFVNDLVTKHSVYVEGNESDRFNTGDPVQQKCHIFPEGHQIILTDIMHRTPKDVFEVSLQVSDYSEGCSYSLSKEDHVIIMRIPKYNEGRSKEKEQLHIAMKQVLDIVQGEDITQLSMCLEEIGGWSFRTLVKQVLANLKEYMTEALEFPITVHLSTTDAEKYKEVERIFVKGFPDTDGEPQTSHMVFDETHFETKASKDGLQIDVWKNNLLETEADVLVYAADPNLNLNEGVLSALLAAKAGQELQDELKKNAQGKKIKPWRFVCTGGYKLLYQFVLHGALDKFKDRLSVKDMQNFIYRCLLKAEELKMKSIVFPALGAGKCKYRLEDIAVAVYEAAMLFEMKNPCPYLANVTIVAFDNNTCDVLSREIQCKHETNLLSVGKILLRGRLTKIDAVMADSLIVFWEMNAFKSVPVQDLSLLWPAGTEVQKIFRRERNRKGAGRTFTTPGGNFYSKSIVHVPFNDDESKLESAFQDGIETVEKDGCESCVLYFPEKSPMLKYKEKMVKHLLKAIETQSEKLASLKFIVVVIDSSDETFLYWFEQYSKPPVPTGGQIQQKSATKIVKPEVSQAVKITGSKENVKRATEELEDKIALLQKDVKGSNKLPVTPPGEQKISRSDRGVLNNPHTEGLESELRATGHAAKMAVHHETGKKREPATVHEKTQKGAREDQRKLEQSKDSDIQHAHEWNPSFLVHDEYGCRCIEVGNIEGIETYEALLRTIVSHQLPVLVPQLIYPFESEHKALLICQKDKDADKLDGFKHKKSQYTYKKLNPQCLQMMKVCLPHTYINDRKEKGEFDKLKVKLEEIGDVEMPKSEDLSVTVTVFTVSQMKVLNDVLKTFEVGVVEKSSSSGSIIHEEIVPRGGQLKTIHKNTSSDFTTRSHDDSVRCGRNPLSNDFSDACNVEKISDVSELLWKVLNNLKVDTMNQLKWISINVIYQNDSILIDGHTDKTAITDIMADIKQLKQLQMEEIKPTKMASTHEYIQWCTDTRSALGKECCVYDEDNSRFIAFGESYDDISKVKHQLGLKQGMIKQTGRRRNRNFDAPAPPVMPEVDSGSRSMPSSSKSMSEPKRGSPDFKWSTDAKQRQEYTTDEGIKIYVYIADILKLPVDCIVNAANDNLQHGGGVAWVIAKAAGWELTHEGDKYIRNSGLIPVGMACTTTAGKLPYDCVIHAVGPRWSDYRPHTLQKVKECESLLQNAIISSFTLAEKRNLKTIALPAISSAIFGVPEDMCAVQYAKAVLKYSSGSVTNAQKLKEIHFTDKNPSIIRLIQETFQVMIEDKKKTDYDKMNYVTDKSLVSGQSSVYSRSTRRPVESLETNKDMPFYVETVEGCEVLAKNGSKVFLYHGNILEANKRKVSSVVCSDDHTGRGIGGLANALMSKANRFSYGKDKYEAFQWKNPKAGQVVVSAGQGTGFEKVLHAVLWDSGYKEDQKDVVLTAYKNLLNETDWKGLNSVALPLLGTGSYKSISLEDSAEAFMSSYLDFCDTKKADSRLSIHLICKDSSDTTKVNEVLKRFLQREEKTSEPARKKSKDDHHDISDEEKDSKATDETCCICMETVSNPKSLPCGHVFCVGCIDEYLEKYKKACPTCGKVCGIIKGDQPGGKMSVTTNKWNHCAGYESYGRIEIVYSFPSGYQGSEHPDPGKFYHGITRNAYLPDNKEGQEILALLRIAFDRKLVFTIGHSRTTGKDGVITWNDIHQKTNPQPGGNFGYPDPGYFDRVKDELAAKGVTVDDIPQLSSQPQLSGDRSVRSRRH